jgi:hypothetical protein
MKNNREVVVKVPNPNACATHFTTASEVSTVDFVSSFELHRRQILVMRLDWEASRIPGTPTHVHAWNSQAKLHPIGAEFIIMGKVESVPLSQIWSMLQLQQRLKLIIAVTSPQKRCLSVSFSHYSSLYYAGDFQSPAGSHHVKEGMAAKDSEFAIGVRIPRGPLPIASVDFGHVGGLSWLT